jgi:hypothetical protein
MADRPPDPDTADDTGVRPTADRPPSTPRWASVQKRLSRMKARSSSIMTQEAHEGRSPAGRPGPLRRLLPIAGSTVAVVAVLAHFGGGSVLVPAHLGLGAALLAKFGGGALVVVLAAFVTIKLLLVFGARGWLRHRRSHAAGKRVSIPTISLLSPTIAKFLRKPDSRDRISYHPPASEEMKADEYPRSSRR